MTGTDPLSLLLWSLAGTLCSAVVAPIPALHIYNVAGAIFLLGTALAPEPLAFFMLGLLTGYAFINTLPGIFLAAPDDSTLFLVLPGQKYLLQHRGYEAVVLSGIGGLAGLTALTLAVPLAPAAVAALREILRPHLGWILWSVIAYLLLSEWPRGSDRAPVGWRRWWDGWRSLTAGLATFLLSGILGMVLMYRSPVPPTAAGQAMLPAFVGLYAVPWMIQNLQARIKLPAQLRPQSIDAPWDCLLRGTLSGTLGGLFAAFFPVVTGGMGGLLAGQATAQRDERSFIIAQGASKVVYYTGGFLLFFMPGVHLTRGGMAWMVSTRYSSFTPDRYYLSAAAVLISGVLAFFLSLGLARLMLKLTAGCSYRTLSGGSLVLLILLVGGLTGLPGLAILAVATGIGMLPALWGARRINAMGLLLLPIALNMSGAGDTVAGWLGLL